MTAIELSSYAGLVAVTLATLNICLGLLISVRYSPVRYWPHRKHINIFQLHTWTGYLVLAFVVIHPAILLLIRDPHFRVFDIVLPVQSPQQPFENTLGAIAAYAVVIVVVTSIFRIAIGRKLWKALHLLVYPSAALLFVHGILTNQNLDNKAVDYLDGEKVYIEICLLVVIAISIWAWQFRAKKQRRERTLHVGRYSHVQGD
jgi:DMSO/TMAO reductase YedYZ heme-binding membrane subunit